MRLGVPGERGGRTGGGAGCGRGEEAEETYGEETLSPVKLSFRGGRGGGGGGGRISEDRDGSVSSLSLDGVALSAVGCSE